MKSNGVEYFYILYVKHCRRVPTICYKLIKIFFFFRMQTVNNNIKMLKPEILTATMYNILKYSSEENKQESIWCGYFYIPLCGAANEYLHNKLLVH